MTLDTNLEGMRGLIDAEISAQPDTRNGRITSDPIDIENAQREAAGLPPRTASSLGITPELFKLCAEICNLINSNSDLLFQRLAELSKDPELYHSIETTYLKKYNKSIYSHVDQNLRKKEEHLKNPFQYELTLTELEEFSAKTRDKRARLAAKVLRSDAFDITSNAPPDVRESNTQMLRRLLIKGDGSLSRSTSPEYVDYIPEIAKAYEAEYNESFSARLMSVDPIMATQIEYGYRYPIGHQPSLQEFHAKRNAE